MPKLIAVGSSTIIAPWSFPAIIAKKLNYEFVSKAKPIISNHKITRKILSYESYQPGDFVLADWTSTVRHEFRTQQGWTGTSRGNIKPGSVFEEQWYQGPGQWEYTGVYFALKEILLAQTFLVNKNIPYLFVFDNNEVLDSMLYKEPDPYLASLISLINWDQFLWFENNGFVNWCKKHNYEFDGTHPVKSAHQAAAEYILNNFKLPCSFS